MTNKDKIKYLIKYTRIAEEILLINQSYEQFYTKIYSTPISKLSDMPKSNNQTIDKIGIDVANLEHLRKELTERITKLQNLRQDIQQKIWEIPDPTLRMLMSLRYLDCQKWEEICVKLNYSWVQIHRLHSIALKKLNL